jgi:hypothetical protein
MTWLLAKSSLSVQRYRELCAESKELSAERKHLSAEPAIPVVKRGFKPDANSHFSSSEHSAGHGHWSAKPT